MSLLRRSALALLLLGAAGCGATGGPDGPRAGGDPPVEALAGAEDVRVAEGVHVRVPRGWHRAGTALTPGLADPRELLAVGTYPLRAGGDRCGHWPVRALEDLGPSGALLVLFERRDVEDLDAYPPREVPAARGFERGTNRFCVPDARREDRWLAFSDHGRAFYALLAVGPDAPADVREALFAILDSLVFVQP